MVFRGVSFFVSVVAAFALVVGSAASAPFVPLGPQAYVLGATDDAALGQADGGAAMYDQMRGYGLGAIRMNVHYDPTQPTTIQQRAALARAIAPAAARGMRVFLSIAPDHATDVTADPDGPQKFAAYAALVAQAFPQVHDFIVGNEPNLGRFWAPTFNTDLTMAAPASYEATLAATYDALKAVDPNIDVIGFALAERGDDRPGSARKTISPVRFIEAAGAAYRASGRTAPIMDNVALHPYPNVNTDTPEKGFAWPNVGVPNLDRGEQAFWDAFHGTGQPTFEEGAPRRLQLDSATPYVRWIFDESGWQTNTQNLPGYTGTETVPTVDEAAQATYYADVVRRFSCDAHVAALLFFNWEDESDRDRFQTGPIRADGTAKPAAAAVESAAAGGCTSQWVSWTHSESVDGAAVDFDPRAGYVLFVHANEDATFTATATAKKKVHGKRKVVRVTGNVDAYLGRAVKFRGIRASKKDLRKYRFSVTLAAAVNPARISIFTH
jgi:hypothetical protein